MIGDLSFDPWEFARKNEQDQRVLLSDLLYNITGGKLNLADFDVRKQEAFDQRTDANREKKRLANLLANIRPPVDNEPTEEISIAALTASINDALNTNNKIVNLQNDNKRSQELLDQSVKEIARLQAIIADCENKIHGNANVLSGIDTLDVAHLQDQLKDIETNNRRAREVVEYRTLRTGLENVEKEIVGYNATMELIEIEKAEALEAAPLPVKGFTVNADGVRIINEDGSDVPFCQASAARRLKISLGIAMAANPTLRVIRIADGSLLDDESMAIVKEMATDKDFQVWIEYASRNTDDRIGVYIEDGKVA
jgi:hypothetical protein